MKKESLRETIKNTKDLCSLCWFFFWFLYYHLRGLGTTCFQLDTTHKYIESSKLPSVRDDRQNWCQVSLRRIKLWGISNADLNTVVKNHSHFPTEKQLINNRQSPSSAAEVQEMKGFLSLRIPQLLESYIILETESETAPGRKISVKRNLLQIIGTLYRCNRNDSSSPPIFQRLVSTRFLSLPSNQFLSLREWTSPAKTF